MKLNDPAVVKEQYATDDGLSRRIAAFRFATGPDARDMAFQAVAQAAPSRVLEVGCGRGELAARISEELDCELVAIDQSEHMVSLTRSRGVDARVGDVQSLAFADGEFDVVLAAWVLFHMTDIDRALDEIDRVLRPGGRIVAGTNAADHMRELQELLGTSFDFPVFDADDGERRLRERYDDVDVRDAHGWVDFPSRKEAQEYVDATMSFSGRQLPDLDGPVRVTRGPVVLVATKGAA